VDLVFLGGLGEYEDVIKVNNDEGVQMLAEDLVHEALKGGWGIGEAEGDDGEFKVAVTSAEGSLGDVSFGDSDLVVALAEVNLGKDGGTMKPVKHVVHAGKGV
jgi:hypothetical protein